MQTFKQRAVQSSEKQPNITLKIII